MASSVANIKQSCVKCDKGAGTAICSGCQQQYCVKHFLEHRQELETQMDDIGQQHDLLRRDLLKETTEHPFLTRIDTWEIESITKIQVAAEVARVDLRELIDRTNENVKKSVDKITNEIQSSQELNDYTEVDLRKWSNKLKELRITFEKPINIDSLFENPLESSINLIKVTTKSDYSRPILSAIKTNSRASENLDFMQIQERFDALYGPVILSERGLVAKNNSDDYSRICGVKQYSSGVNRIEFRIEERTASCPFIGIISLVEGISLRKITLPSANGWSDLDYVVTNGRSLSATVSNKTIQSGDDVTLILDCDNREILLEHHRTNRVVHQLINTLQCPLPWKILVALSPHNGCIRILGSTK